jgi:zeaxanthin epoxidase
MFLFAKYAVASVAVVSGVSAFTLPNNIGRQQTVLNVIGQQAESVGPATAIRKLKTSLPQIEWLAEGDGNPNNKVDMPEYIKQVLAQPEAPRREAESEERTHKIRTRADEAARDAAALRGMLVGEEDKQAWWRTPRETPKGGREVTKDDPLTVLIAGGGLAGLVTASACHAKGMKVALFEQASSYAPYGGQIQMQSNALRAIQSISQECYEELVKAGTVTSYRRSSFWFEDRVSQGKQARWIIRCWRLARTLRHCWTCYRSRASRHCRR